MTSSLYVLDRASHRLYPAADNRQRESRRKCGAYERSASERDGDPGSCLCASLLVAQEFEQHRGKHRIAILASLALLDAQHHAFGVDVRDLQRDHLGNTQTCTTGDTQRRLVLHPRPPPHTPRSPLATYH